ncbi:MAG: GNAT family N-acetyltransferase [Clostridia bacterium]|nr:GNAT family N-acetyltransferase [Clostridia bacterium]
MFYSAEKIMLRDGRSCIIRSVGPEDAAPVLGYMKIMLGETPFLLRTPEEFSYTEEDEAAILAERLDDPRCLMLTAELDGRIAALADISSHGAKSRVSHRAELGISVRKDFWSLGIGSALMERLIRFAKEAGYEQIELTVESGNLRAIALYLRFGFTVYGTRPHGMKYPDGSYDDDYLMLKKL